LKTNTERLHVLILVFGLLLGAYARLLPAMMVGFPPGDGGLFFAMVKALQASHYALPLFVEYNGISIPFVYPPLGFYIAGLTSDLFHIPLIEVFRWLPAAGSIAFSAAVFPLASSILNSKLKGVLAAVFFALLPRSVSFYVMGGGITRVWGTLFLLLTLFSAHKLFSAPSKKYLWLTILFGGGVVLSHPEAALHAVSLSLVLWAFFGRSKVGIKNALLAALGVTMTTAPFFFVTISRHGIQPYLSAAQTGFQSPLAWLAILTGSFSDEKFVTLISALALLGLVVSIARRDFLPAVMLLVPAIVDPRSAAAFSLISWVMLAANGFVDVIIPGLSAQNVEDVESNWYDCFIKSPAIRFALTGLIFYAFIGAVLSDQVYPKVSLTPSDRRAMGWVADNIPANNRFVILTGETETFADSVSEWFPVLTKSASIAAVQGYEWMPGQIFLRKIDEYYALQPCLNKTFKCVEKWSAETGSQFEYLLISQEDLSKNENLLLASLLESTAYEKMYQDGDIAIFKRRP
jgi:hypothetical protein